MKLSKELFKTLRELTISAVPNEVGGVILGKEVGKDFVLFPAEFSRHYVKMNLFNIPIYTDILGTFHSHPNGIVRPSAADLKMFRKMGNFHLIFGPNNFKCYDNSGKEVELIIQ